MADSTGLDMRTQDSLSMCMVLANDPDVSKLGLCLRFSVMRVLASWQGLAPQYKLLAFASCPDSLS